MCELAYGIVITLVGWVLVFTGFLSIRDSLRGFSPPTKCKGIVYESTADEERSRANSL